MAILLSRRSNLLAVVVLLLCQLFLYATVSSSGSVLKQGGGEEFSEELLLKPFPDRKVLAHFHFQSRAPHSSSHGRHHHLFPKAIAQLVKKFRVKEMELSFTQGRWRYEQWGGFDPLSSNNAKPPGVELWAVFDVPQSLVDVYWRNLTHTLSGLFCASINFLESSTTYSAPELTFKPSFGNLRYGTLPREAVCTENLTPWLKLLPCRDKAGLSALMDRPSIYRGFYHSQRLRLTSSESGSDEVDSGIGLDQTLTVVLQPSSWRTGKTYSVETNIQPSWSISSIFGRNIPGKCVIAKSSNVYLQLDNGLVGELKNLERENAKYVANTFESEGFQSNHAFKISVTPDKVFEEVDNLHGKSTSVIYGFSVEKYNDSQPFDLGLTWKIPVVWSCQQAPLHASRFLMGSGNERGAIAISLEPTESSEGLPTSHIIDGRCELRVDIFQVVPWYIKVYFHTLQVFVDKQPRAMADVVDKIRVSPSKDKVSPGVMEMILKLPCGSKSAAFSLEFDKGFLHIDEYPPDANQGFDIPSALISFPSFNARMNFSEDEFLNNSPILSKFQETSPVLSYTEVLLIPLTTPDFSMPYNVITITCTVFALYFGSLLNVLRRRVDEEERILRSRAGRKAGWISQLLSRLSAKLRGRPQEQPTSSLPHSFISFRLVLKILLVASIAVTWQYYFG